MLALALVKDLDGAGVALLDIGLSDLGDRLALRDVIADRNVDRREPACGSGDGIDDAAATADQNPLTGARVGICPTTPHISAAARARQITSVRISQTAW